ncbi:MAG: hypothetical protein JSS63_14550 [Bacteroidetes bacterium]|nr:hypothetical protein [Bacteroidota bacterium]
MIEPPFKIFYQNRPLRICYLLDINDSEIKNILEIMGYCNRLWGGKGNPIIFSDGKTVSNEDLIFLKAYDPDIIKSYINLDINLVTLFELELSPFEIEVPRSNDSEILPIPFKRPVEFSMSLSSVKDFTKDLMPPKLSLFSYHSQTQSTLSENLRNFIKINFGVFSNTLYDQLNLKDTSHEIITLSDEINFIKDFKNILDWNRRIFQNQFASYSNYQIEPEDYKNIYSHFSIIIGDSIKELTYFWNEHFFKRPGCFPRIRSLWIPYEIAIDPNYSEIFEDFIRIYSTSVSGNTTVKFISFTIQEDELKNLGDIFTKDLFVHKVYEKKETFCLPEMKNYQHYHNIKTNWKYFNATNKEVTLEIEQPDNIQHPSNYLSWGADIAIEYKSQRFKNISGPEYWLQIPKRNWLSIIQNNYSRVNNHFFLSTIASGTKSTISVRVDNDYYIFQELLTNRHHNYYPTSDPRNQITKNYYEDMYFSDNGGYLQGILELFKGLHNASAYLKERYWRVVFDRMSNRLKFEDELSLSNIEKEVRKHMSNIIKDIKINKDKIDELPDRMIEYMRNKIYNTTKKSPKSGIELTFEKLKKNCRNRIRRIYKATSIKQ